MLSFHVTFVQPQTERRTDRRTTVKQYAPNLSIWGHKNIYAKLFIKIIESLNCFMSETSLCFYVSAVQVF